jgi:hypothetical protein
LPIDNVNRLRRTDALTHQALDEDRQVRRHAHGSEVGARLAHESIDLLVTDSIGQPGSQ